MRTKVSQSYRFWDIVELIIQGITDGKDPLASHFGRFQVPESTAPDLEIVKTSSLEPGEWMLLPENRGFVSSEGLGWAEESKREGQGFFLEWPRKTSEKWRLTVALDEMRLPQFRHFLDLKALSKEVVAIHGSAVAWKGRSVIAAGPPAVGKTSLIAGLVRDGGELVGDDWLWMRTIEDRTSVLGINETIELSPEKLNFLIDRKELSWSTRKQFWKERLLKELALLLRSFSRPFSPFVTHKAWNFAARRKITVPVDYFRSQEWRDSSTQSLPVSHCFLIVQSKKDQISLHPVRASDMARRLTRLNQIERAWMYEISRYAELALPEPKLELGEFEEAERHLLNNLLRDVDCHLISYPKNIDPNRLRRVIVRQIEEDLRNKLLMSRAHHG